MSSYRALLARPGARRLALSCGVGWWALNGYGLALVLSLEYASGSFAVAGAGAAGFAAGSAVLAPVRGRAIDRGGSPVLRRLAGVHIGMLTTLAVACQVDSSPIWLMVSSATVAGASVPPITATARTSWARLAGPDLARSAHALNATLGEAAAIASPVSVSVIAAAASPGLALGALLPATALAATGVAASTQAVPSQPGKDARERGCPTGPSRSRRSTRSRSLLRGSPGLRWLVAADVACGLWLGGLEIAATALAVDAGSRVLAGGPLLALAVGGLAASVWSGTARACSAARRRYLWGAIGASLVFPLALIAPGIATLTLVCLAGGIALGLINVALFELVDEVAPEGRTVEAFTWITTAQATGLALGAAAAGALADRDPAQALVVVAGGALLGATVATGGQRALREASYADTGTASVSAGTADTKS